MTLGIAILGVGWIGGVHARAATAAEDALRVGDGEARDGRTALVCGVMG